jgi:hypothetical protein
VPPLGSRGREGAVARVVGEEVTAARVAWEGGRCCSWRVGGRAPLLGSLARFVGDGGHHRLDRVSTSINMGGRRRHVRLT